MELNFSNKNEDDDELEMKLTINQDRELNEMEQ
jgi:hypothetical protein